MVESKVEDIEISLLLEAVFQRYGYDFRGYARASITRRTRQCQEAGGFPRIADMIPAVLHDAGSFTLLLRHFSIPVTEMFRDPFVFQAVRTDILPLLRTWPHIKIWLAGCATGEEAYSLAIVLKEEGLYDRATLYATDLNAEALERARTGIYDLGRLRQATRSYQAAGGRGSFSEYFHANYDAGVMNESLRERIVFSSHNLATDSAFGDMHLVFCRNVLIYFNRELQSRVLGLFAECLVPGGFLCLGTKEDIQFTEARGNFEEVDRRARLFKRGIGPCVARPS
ncbi:MAG: protein-glutamate O-methyltransferase CheR [Telmatospirillum sp.]|nr:protein-glutamate O-methyltransferase CheR [Telmatospirillum sp.]